MEHKTLPQAEDLLEVIRKSVEEGVSIGGWVMR